MTVRPLRERLIEVFEADQRSEIDIADTMTDEIMDAFSSNDDLSLSPSDMNKVKKIISEYARGLVISFDRTPAQEDEIVDILLQLKRGDQL